MQIQLYGDLGEYNGIYDVEKILEAKPNLSMRMMKEVTDQLVLCQKDDRRAFMRYGIAELLKAKPNISPGEFRSFLAEMRRRDMHPKQGRYYLIRDVVAVILRAEPEITLQKFALILSMVMQNLQKGGGFLPSWILTSFKHNQSDITCGCTEFLFNKALDRGSLIKATMRIGGQITDVYIKGFLSSTGNVLAYEPKTNVVYAVKIRDGVVEEAEAKDKFQHDNLRKRIEGMEKA